MLMNEMFNSRHECMYINYIYDIIIITFLYKKIMNEHIMKVPFHIDKLSPENQLVIVNLVNHLNSSGELYRENVINRLKEINKENCMTFLKDLV